MTTPETQQQQPNPMHADFLAMTGGNVPAPEPETIEEEEGAGQDPKNAAEQPAEKPAEQAAKPDVEQAAEPTAEEKSADWMDEYIGGGTEQKPIEVNDDVKAFFKNHLGAEDPAKFLADYRTSQEQTTRLSEELAQAQSVTKALESLPVNLQNAVRMAAKGEDAMAYLSSLPKLDWDKPAAKQDAQQLLDAYFPGKVTADDIEAMKDGDDTAKDKYENYLSMAREKFEAKRQEVVEYGKEQDRLQAEQQKKFHGSVDQALATVKATPGLATFANGDLRNQLLSGDLVNKTLFNDDGTYKPEAALVILKGLNHDAIMKRMAARLGREATEKAQIDTMQRTPDTMRSRAGGSDSDANRGRAEKPKELADWEVMTGQA